MTNFETLIELNLKNVLPNCKKLENKITIRIII